MLARCPLAPRREFPPAMPCNPPAQPFIVQSAGMGWLREVVLRRPAKLLGDQPKVLQHSPLRLEARQHFLLSHRILLTELPLCTGDSIAQEFPANQIPVSRII